MLLQPQPLAPGAQVRVLSPSGPVTPELLAPGLEVLRSWGLDVSVDERTYGRDRYLAGADELRAAALNEALRDPAVDAVVFSRGGYGAMRILDAVDWEALAAHPIPLVGFSDITALHLAALQRASVATLHGPVVKSFGLQAQDVDALRASLFGEARQTRFDVRELSPGVARGRLVGGNLSLVASMLASDCAGALAGAVLVLEDVTEEDYRLDRLFTALRLSPASRNLAAIVLGEFVGCAGAHVCEEEMEAFTDSLGAELGAALDIPVVAGFPCGHGSRNVPFAHGARAEVDAGAGTVTFLEDLTG